MEDNLKQTLLEMRRLMNYDRSSNSLLNEQDPEAIRWDGEKFSTYLSTVGKQAKGMVTNWCTEKGSLCYRQNFEPYKGYFDNVTMLGECFDIELFDYNNTNAPMAMDIPKDKVFKEGTNYYINGTTLEYGKESPIRVYLPKDEFFKSLMGVIKSFTAYPTCIDQQNKENGKKYTLIYQLTDPSKAILQRTINADGIVDATSDDASRGWTISLFGGYQSGYFRYKGTGDASSSDLTPGNYAEYTLDGYSNEYGRSAFDIWYDSGWGTVIQITGAIIVGMISAGVGTVLAAGLEGAAATMVVLGTEIVGEYLIAIPEAIYLTKRGQNGSAAFVLVLALLPVFNRLGFIKRAAGILTKGEIDDLIARSIDESGKFTTPGDIKQYMKNLTYKERMFLENFVQDAAEGLSKIEQKTLQDEIYAGLKSVFTQTVAKKVITKGIEKTAEKVLKNLPKTFGGSGLKLIGIDLAAIAASMPIIYSVFEDDEKLRDDPQGFLDQLEKNGERINNLITEDIRKKAEEIGLKLKTDMETASEDDQYQKALLYINYLKGIAKIGEEDSYSLQESEAYKSLYDMVMVDIKIEQIKNENNKQWEEYKKKKDMAIEIFGEEAYWNNILSYCKDIIAPTFKSIDDACLFLDWVLEKKPNTSYYIEDTKNNVSVEFTISANCDVKRNNMEQPDWVTIQDCDIRNAWNKYGTEYLKKNPELKQQITQQLRNFC